MPAGDILLVLDHQHFNHPLVLLTHDGTLPVPEPGCLFQATDAFPATLFPDFASASLAIRATLDWGAAHCRAWEPDHYQIVTLAEYEAHLSPSARAREARAARRKRNRARYTHQHEVSTPNDREESCG